MSERHKTALCGTQPGERCYKMDCPEIMQCDPLKKTTVFYPIAEPRHRCQYVDAAGHRCHKIAYYRVSVAGRMEYRCYYDCPIGLRTPGNKIRMMKGPKQ